MLKFGGPLLGDRPCPADGLFRSTGIAALSTANQMLSENVFDRRDDHEPPVDLPARTKEIVKNTGWVNDVRQEHPAVLQPLSAPAANVWLLTEEIHERR